MEYNPDNQVKQFKEAQGKHLRTLEKWAGEQPQVNGVPVIQALVYDLIQITNQAYLQKALGEADNG